MYDNVSLGQHSLVSIFFCLAGFGHIILVQVQRFQPRWLNAQIIHRFHSAKRSLDSKILDLLKRLLSLLRFVHGVNRFSATFERRKQRKPFGDLLH